MGRSHRGLRGSRGNAVFGLISLGLPSDCHHAYQDCENPSWVAGLYVYSDRSSSFSEIPCVLHQRARRTNAKFLFHQGNLPFIHLPSGTTSGSRPSTQGFSCFSDKLFADSDSIRRLRRSEITSCQERMFKLTDWVSCSVEAPTLHVCAELPILCEMTHGKL